MKTTLLNESSTLFFHVKCKFNYQSHISYQVRLLIMGSIANTCVMDLPQLRIYQPERISSCTCAQIMEDSVHISTMKPWQETRMAYQVVTHAMTFTSIGKPLWMARILLSLDSREPTQSLWLIQPAFCWEVGICTSSANLRMLWEMVRKQGLIAGLV